MAAQGLGDLKPVYLIYGDEELLLERAVRRLRDRVAEVADLDFNFDVFEGESADADAIVAAANTMPFMSERRLVVVHDTDKMPAAALNILAEYAADPAPHAVLVLVARKLARSTRLFQAVDALKGTYEYTAPKPSEYPSHVTEMFAERGKSVALDAAQAVVQAVGRDLRRLESEVDKIAAFSGGTATLSREDIEGVLSVVAPVSVFDFLDALGNRDCRSSLKTLADLLAQGESVHGIHAMAARQVRTLLSARALLDRGLKPFAVGRELGLRKEWQVRRIVAQAERFQSSELIDLLRGAAGTEADMKTGSELRLVFERWVVGVCRRG
jgi:DNA polymerase-3 subunit delta